MSTERWRQAAYELLPTFRHRIGRAEGVGALWIELWDCEVEGARDEPLGGEEMSGLFRYASWCLLSGDEEAQDAAIVDFYEKLPTNVGIRRDLHRHMSVEDFLGLKGIFGYHLSEEGHMEFVEEFLAEARRVQPARSRPAGEA